MIQQMQAACSDCSGEGFQIPASEKCKACQGEKLKKVQKVLEVHVEPGMRHGEHVTFHGEGDQIDPQVEAGDVVVVINVKDHAVFKRNGDNLHMVKEISLNEALCGYEIPITHLDGRKLLLKSAPGDIIRPDDIRGVIGEGMPKRRHHEIRGTLFVKFDVKFPVSHFLDDEKKYKLLASCFPAVKAVTLPAGEYEEVSLFEYDEKKYGGRRGEAYEDESDSDEGPGAHGSHVQCAQS
jgi:DnaJ family protein A protein 2